MPTGMGCFGPDNEFPRLANRLALRKFPNSGQERGRIARVGGTKEDALMSQRRKKAARKRAPAKTASHQRHGGAKKASRKRWSQHVTDTSDALDLKHGVFKLHDPRRIAASLKRSAEQSDRRKANPYRSALSMLTFYINRAGKNLPKTQVTRLQRAKDELKKQFGRP
jgi:hypothetical protein